MRRFCPYIIFFTQTNKISGGERSMLEILSNLKDEMRISVILPEGGELEELIRENGINVIRIKDYRFFKIKRENIHNIIFSIGEFFESIIKIRDLIKKKKVDILWTNSQKAHIIGVFVKLLTGVRLVWHFRDILEGKNCFIINIFSLFPDRIIAISNAVRRQFLLKRKIYVIYNGMRINEKIVKKIKGRFFKIGYVGQIARWKGQMNFLKIMKEIEGAKGFIIGDVLFDERDYYEELMEFVNKEGLKDKVFFLGFKKDILNYIYSMDILVHLPLKPEPFGRVIMEAMALGIPVISHRIGAIEEIMGNSGIIVEYNDLEEVKKWINEIMFDKRKREEIGKRERMIFTERYASEKYIKNIKKVIREILKLT